jgi:hypothetical protein
MKPKIIVFIVVGILIAGWIAWYLISPLFIVIEMDEDLPTDIQNGNASTEEMALVMGDFMPSAHEVEGKALVIESESRKILRFEDFETDNGPNLHIYLATDTNVDDYIDLGEIKATKGNVNYDIPEEVDLEKYDTVVVWCVPFRVLFSYAELS